MNNITEERKSWHNAELSKEDLCPACNKGLLLPKSSYDVRNDDVYYWAECSLNCGYKTS